MIILETERLCLRDYVETDFEAYYKLKTDDETMYYMKDIKLDDRESARFEFMTISIAAVTTAVIAIDTAKLLAKPTPE